MSDNFDWQTEDDSAWELNETRPERMARSITWPWRMLAVAAGLLAVAALAAYWQFSQRIERLTAVVENDVLSTHNLINRAVATQDLELMAPLLSARDLSWTNAQEQLLEKALFYDRAPLGLPLAGTAASLPDLSAADVYFINIEVAPDMNSAELHFLQEHDPGAGRNSVMLAHTAVYRRGHSRWLLSPPDDAFWGAWQTSETEWLTLVYPARDAEVAQKLAADLAMVLADACQQLTPLTCPATFNLNVRLEPDPAVLLALTDPTTLYDANLRVNLPAPTLVGLPVDEAGYQALLRGYAAPLVAVMITELIGWECCVHAPFYQAFMDYQLNQLGLRSWPVSAETHAQIINSGVNVDALSSFYPEAAFDALESPEMWQLYAFVDFLMRQHPDLAPVEILIGLNRPQTFQTWLAGLFGSDRDEGVVIKERLSRDWWLFAHAQMVASQGPRPLPFPEQDLQLTCVDDFEEMAVTTLYRYELDEDKWQPEVSLDGFMVVNPLPGDEATLLQTINVVTEEIVPFIWQGGAGLPIAPEVNPLSWGQTDPTGRYLLIYGREAEGDYTQQLLIDVPSCATGTCTLISLNGLPAWSPDGSQMILSQLSFPENALLPATSGRLALFAGDTLSLANVPLYRADTIGSLESQVVLADMVEPPGGNLPFWLDAQTYGYVHVAQGFVGEAQQEIFLASTADDVPRLILTTDDLLAAIPEAERPFRLSIRYVLAHPIDPDLLVVMATSRTENVLFVVNWQDSLVETRLRLPPHNYHFFGFSPDGRYFVATGAPEADSTAPQDVIVYHLHDLARRETHTYVAGSSAFIPTFSFDWSADGEWLALVLNDGVISLVAPDYGYQHLILHDYGSCSSLAWVNPPPDHP